MRILVADDHYANRLLTESLLLRHGHSVEVADNGKQAWELCHSHVFDLILLDIQMPVMDGFEALKAIQTSDNKNKDLPIFALTAHTGPLEMAAMIGAGFHAVLKKPFRISEMMKHLASTQAAAPKETKKEAENIKLLNKYADVLSLTLLELRTLDILIRAIGSERMQDVLTAYWIDASMMLETLKQHRPQDASSSADVLVEVRRTAHGLKGASANIGLLKASRIASQLQNAPIENVAFLIHALDITLEESKGALATYCKSKTEAQNPEPMPDIMVS